MKLSHASESEILWWEHLIHKILKCYHIGPKLVCPSYQWYLVRFHSLNYIKQVLVNQCLQVKSYPPAVVFVNKVLLAHTKTPSFTCHLWLLSYQNRRVKYVKRQNCLRILKYWLSGPFQKGLLTFCRERGTTEAKHRVVPCASHSAWLCSKAASSPLCRV